MKKQLLNLLLLALMNHLNADDLGRPIIPISVVFMHLSVFKEGLLPQLWNKFIKMVLNYSPQTVKSEGMI